MADASYILVRMPDRTHLGEASTMLSGLDGLDRWDATDGYYQAVVRCCGDVDDCQDKLQALNLDIQTAICRVLNHGKSVVLDPETCHSYLLIEATLDQHDNLAATLRGMNPVLSCESVEGPYDLVVVVEATTFDEIDRFVNEQVNVLDGVLRLKQDRIIRSHPSNLERA